MKRSNFDMKILFLFVLQLIFFTLPSYAGEEEKAVQVKTFYIKVSGNGGSFSIAPSMHGSFQIPFPYFYASAIRQEISKAKGLCLEADAVSARADILAGKYAQKMIVNEKYNVLRYLDKQEKLQILATNAKLTPEQAHTYFSRATPFAIQQDAIGGAIKEKRNYPSLDINFEEFAKIVKVPVFFLESSSEGADQVIQTFTDIKGWQTSLLKLADFLECEECKKKYTQYGLDMEEAFFLRSDSQQAKIDYEELEKLSGSDSPMGLVHGDKRSMYLLEKILARANANECTVFAIGAAHFWGQHSLQEEFKKRGYTVEVVNVVRE